ncbi:hypothetical protein SRRS_19720 [Sporomusa rhizae]
MARVAEIEPYEKNIHRQYKTEERGLTFGISPKAC